MFSPLAPVISWVWRLAHTPSVLQEVINGFPGSTLDGVVFHFSICVAVFRFSDSLLGMQADQVIAKAQQAAADAAQRSDEEAAKVRRELEALKKEKRGLVQRCTRAERDLAAAMVCVRC